MENEHQQNIVSVNGYYEFLTDPSAKDVFGKIDFELKSGMHIQFLHPEQESNFAFIERYHESLNQYYIDFFGVTLGRGGESTDTYFYLDFEEKKRGTIPPEQRYFLSEEHLIIGLFACKVYAIDFNSEESTITTFKKMMREEYEEYKEDFYRLLAQVKTTTYTGDDDIELEKSIQSAFKEFKKLGWVYFKNEEQFVVMPSLERLRKLYADEINNIQRVTQLYQLQEKE